jgi:hypothetical protein
MRGSDMQFWGAVAEPAMESGEISTGRNVFSTLEVATECSIPAMGCIIGVGFDGRALLARKTGIQELLQPVSVDKLGDCGYSVHPSLSSGKHLRMKSGSCGLGPRTLGP